MRQHTSSERPRPSYIFLYVALGEKRLGPPCSKVYFLPPLQLKILVDEDCFKVAVDGSHLLEFEHRVGGMEEVTLLRVQGDMVLHSVAPNMI